MARPRKKPVLLCLLCQAPLQESTVEGVWLHPLSTLGCAVGVTDSTGLSIDDSYVVEDGTLYKLGEEEPEVAKDPVSDLTRLALIPASDLIRLPDEPTKFEHAIGALFDDFGLPRLGGASGDLGWSSFATFQRCPYLWKRIYLDGRRHDPDAEEPEALIIGSAVHTFKAVYYQKMITPDYPLTPEIVHQELLLRGVNHEAIEEAWRVFTAYLLYYTYDYLKPLAIEYHAADPKTRESCRYDMIAEVTEEGPGRPLGTVVVEHKTASRFDNPTLNGWVNDGEVIGQIMLYNRLKLYKRFGELQGVIVNISGKQKEPKFHRTFVSPNRWQTRQHANDLKHWHALKQLYTAQDHFPRARFNCVHRYGMCSQWEHCATGED